MGLPLFKERRANTRLRMKGILPGKMVRSKSQEELPCRAVDVSNNGLGIISDQLVNIGETVVLMAQGQPIELRVVWGRPDFGKDDLRRYGLEGTNAEIDLVAIFKSSGCLA